MNDPSGPAMRHRLDGSVQRFGRVLVGGSPLRLFRVTEAGAAVVDRIAAGEPVRPSRLVAALVDAGAIHPLPEHGPFTEADVTVVTPCRRSPGGDLPHIAPGALLVDDGSVPPLPGAAVRLDVNRGPGAARNAGLARVTTPLVAFVDADVDAAPGWLGPLLAHFADPRVGLVAPRVRSGVRSGDGVGAIANYEHDHSPLDLGDEPALIRCGTRVSYVPSAAIVCRAAALSDVGGFDESLRFGEDVDLVWRLAEAGWRCRYEPASEVRHAPRRSWAGWIRQRVDYGSSTAPLARRHPGALAPVRMSGWSIGTWVLVMFGHPVLGLAVGAGSAAALVRKLPDVPPRAAFRLAARGNLYAGDQLANAVRRVWWPLLVIAAIRSRGARRVLLASALAARTPLRLADDVASSWGVWRGVRAERSPAALIPEISSWPGRQTAGPAEPAGPAATDGAVR